MWIDLQYSVECTVESELVVTCSPSVQCCQLSPPGHQTQGRLTPQEELGGVAVNIFGVIFFSFLFCGVIIPSVIIFFTNYRTSWHFFLLQIYSGIWEEKKKSYFINYSFWHDLYMILFPVAWLTPDVDRMSQFCRLPGWDLAGVGLGRQKCVRNIF